MENATPEPVAVVLPLAAPVVPVVPVKVGVAFAVLPLAAPVVPDIVTVFESVISVPVALSCSLPAVFVTELPLTLLF